MKHIFTGAHDTPASTTRRPPHGGLFLQAGKHTAGPPQVHTTAARSYAPQVNHRRASISRHRLRHARTMTATAGQSRRRPHRCTTPPARSYGPRRYTTHRRKHTLPPPPECPHHDKQGRHAAGAAGAHHAAGDHTPRKCTTRPRDHTPRKYTPPHLRHAVTMTATAGQSHHRGRRCTPPPPARSHAPQVHTAAQVHPATASGMPAPWQAGQASTPQGPQVHHPPREIIRPPQVHHHPASIPCHHHRHAVTMTSRAGNPPEGPQVHTTHAQAGPATASGMPAP